LGWSYFLDWVAVGLSQYLRQGMAMPGHIDDVDLAVWRGISGQVHAWGDRCPHRGMRLSHGFVRGETLSCIYHGWQYGDDGGCTHIPAHPKLIPPKTICATTFRCEEADGVIWVSLSGSPAKPPSLPGNTPVRSIEVHASLKVTASHLGSPDKTILNVGPSKETTLLLQPTGPAQCVVHALTKGDPKDVSQWLESQRINIERVPA
jgi:phenylpropionate dioxygenase-like ring-hydroxylating dioxygenase large terminal subunit